MSRRCPNCDQRLLRSEQFCWHCGERLDPESEDASAGAGATRAQPRAVQPLAVYGAITAGIFAAALLLTAFLGSQPRNRLPLGTLPDGWTVVTDRARQFVIFLPDDWPVLRANDQLAGVLAQQPLYASALLPWADLVEDERFLLLAMAQQPDVFLVVASSTILNRLSAADAVTLLGEGDDRVLQARALQSEGAAQAAFLVELRDARGIQCHQRFLPGREFALLFALCAPSADSAEETANIILSSIQRLQ